jgi:hypothetical protein
MQDGIEAPKNPPSRWHWSYFFLTRLTHAARREWLVFRGCTSGEIGHTCPLDPAGSVPPLLPEG